MVCSLCKNHSNALVRDCSTSHTSAGKSCPSALLSNNDDFLSKFIQLSIDPINTQLKTIQNNLDSNDSNLSKKGECLHEYAKFLYDLSKKDWETRKNRVMNNGILMFKIPIEKAVFVERDFEKEKNGRKVVKNVKMDQFVTYINSMLGKNTITETTAKLMRGNFFSRDKVYIKVGHKKELAKNILKKRSSLSDKHGVDWCYSSDRDRIVTNKLIALKEAQVIAGFFWTIESASLVLLNFGMPAKDSAATTETKRQYSCTVKNPNVDLFHSKATFQTFKKLERFENFVDLSGEIVKK